MKNSNFSRLLSDNRYLLCFLAIGIVYGLNMLIDIMDIDAAQYASISREMLETGSFLQVYHRGEDYLDKPPLLFWLSALSFKIFGISNFSYKLPAVLVLLLGIYSTYRFTGWWYDRKRAVIAALMLGTTQAYFLMTNDVRTDGILTGFVMFSVWQLSLFLRQGAFPGLVLGAIGVACAMMAKGPIGMVIVGFAIGTDLLLKRRWRAIFDARWLLFLFLTGVLLLPMCYGLYTQFDLHPEKEVYNLHGPSGVKFFFWTQSFGRITGDIYWDNNAGFFFFFQTILWDFQPWILFLVPALFQRIKKLITLQLRVPEQLEYLSFGGFALSFLALSTSNYKLPHYIFPLFPFIAVITADYLVSLAENRESRLYPYLKNIQFGLMHLFFLAISINLLFFFEPGSVFLPLIVTLLLVLFWYTFKKIENRVDKVVIPTVIASFALGLALSTNFYPSLLKYQAGSVIGKEIFKRKIQEDQFFHYGIPVHSLDFYSRRIVPAADPEQMNIYKKGTLIYTGEEGKREIIEERQMDYRVAASYDHFRVTQLNIDFLRKSSRARKIQKIYLMEKY